VRFTTDACNAALKSTHTRYRNVLRGNCSSRLSVANYLSAALSTSTTRQFINQRKVKHCSADGQCWCCCCCWCCSEVNEMNPARCARPHRLGEYRRCPGQLIDDRLFRSMPYPERQRISGSGPINSSDLPSHSSTPSRASFRPPGWSMLHAFSFNQSNED